MMGSKSEEKDLKSLRKEVKVLSSEIVRLGEAVDRIEKQSEDNKKELKKDKEEILVVLEKEAKERDYRSDQPVISGVVIQPKELKKLQEDQIRLKKLEEDLEKIKAETINMMESCHRAALEAVRQDSARQVMEVKQELEAAVRTKNESSRRGQQLTKANKELEVALEASRLESARHLMNTKQELEVAQESGRQLVKTKQELEAKSGEMEALNRRLAKEKAATKELKSENKSNIKTMLKLKKEKDEAIAASHLECENKDCYSKVQCKEYAAHREACEYKPVLCPGGKCGKVVVFRDMKEHIKTCPDIVRSIKALGVTICSSLFITDKQLGEATTWSTKGYECNSKYFCLKFRKDAKDTLTAEVVMLGTQADCDKYNVDITILDSTDKPAFRLGSHPRPISWDPRGDVHLTVPRPELLGACARDQEKKEYVLMTCVTICSV